MVLIKALTPIVASLLLLIGAVGAQLSFSNQEAVDMAGLIAPGSFLYPIELRFEQDQDVMENMKIAQERLAEVQVAQIRNSKKHEALALEDHILKVQKIKTQIENTEVEMVSEVQKGLLHARMILEGLLQKTNNTGLQTALFHINQNIQKIEEKRQMKIKELPKNTQGIENAKVDVAQLRKAGVSI